MRHLILCPELPPAPITGGIGTYVSHIARLLAEAGETVHVIGPKWEGAPKALEEHCDGRLIVHRVSCDEPLPVAWNLADPTRAARELRGLAQLEYGPQRFAWQASLLAEALVAQAGIDVVEAQEYAAPLQPFQLRRALGLGPDRQPPCIVHLHSPGEFIVRHNDWDAGHPYFVARKRLEAYTIAAADAWMCPSRSMAEEAEAHFGLGSGGVAVIPLPIGDVTWLERSPRTWQRGPICYVGRLEPRKGVLEWTEAILSVADEHPDARFEFIGADLPYAGNRSVKQVLLERIPPDRIDRFEFLGALPPTEVRRRLARARAAVVPSRWENFPNTCVEAMASGLPVIATRNGGMAQMIEDDRSGWLAERCDGPALAQALRRALAATPERLERMGRSASEAIRKLCDDQRIVERHVQFRERVARRGAARSARLPANLPRLSRAATDDSGRRSAPDRGERGVALVIGGVRDPRTLEDLLASIRRQTRPPCAVLVLAGQGLRDRVARAIASEASQRWALRVPGSGGPAAIKNEAFEAVRALGVSPLGVAFLDARDRLHPSFVERCEAVLRRCPEAGIVSSWVRLVGAEDRCLLEPCPPALPYQLIREEVLSPAVLRTQAFDEVGGHRSLAAAGYESWDLHLGLLAAGWVAVTLPALLAERWLEPGADGPALRPAHGRARGEMLARVPDVVARDAAELVLLLESELARARPARASGEPAPPKPTALLMESLRTQREIVTLALREPGLTLDWLRRTARKAARWLKARLGSGRSRER